MQDQEIKTKSRTYMTTNEKHTEYYINGVLTKTEVTNAVTNELLHTYYPVPPFH